ncbi:MAG: hypothetical protein ABSB66_14870 [Candidatus Acidiferrales bacterium]|jgi:hypothetical protein
MKKVSGILLGICLVLGTASIAAAQEKSEGMHTPPTILRIEREFLKPGKSGLAHDRTESLFVKAMSNAKSPEYYIGMDSMSGKHRALYFIGYNSFAEWEKEVSDERKDPAFSSALDRATATDGELLDSSDQSSWVYRPDQSLNQTASLVGIRYFELEVFQIKQGHDAEWDEAVKLVKQAYANIPDAHWAMYQNVFGHEQPAYLVIIPRKSMSEVDAGFQQAPKFMAAMGADGMKKLSELSAAAIASSETNIFAINPRQSYMMEDLIKADPEFWGPKPAPAPVVKKDKATPKQ